MNKTDMSFDLVENGDQKEIIIQCDEWDDRVTTICLGIQNFSLLAVSHPMP